MATKLEKAAKKKAKGWLGKTETWTSNAHRDMDRAAHNYKEKIAQGYKPSKQVGKYQNLRDDFLKKASGMGDFRYDPKYNEKIEGLLGDAENMKFKMNYSLTDDPAYQQYRDQFIHQGQLAAQDAAGNAVAQTGGYGSTAATAASQQAYNESLTQLNNIVPDLYNQAFNREFNVFTNQRDTLQNLAAAYQSLDQQGYEQALGTWQNNFNQYITLAEEYNRNYEYLDSAERAEYAQQLDALESLLTWRTDLYQNNQQLQGNAVGNYVDTALNISANQDARDQFEKTNALNWAQFNEGKREWEAEFGETVKQHRADEAAALAATNNEGAEAQVKSEVDTLKKSKGNDKTRAFIAQIRTPHEWARSSNYDKTKYGDYKTYVAAMLDKYQGQYTEAELAYLADYYGI